MPCHCCALLIYEEITSMTLNTTVSAKTASSGRIAALSESMIFFVRMEETLMSSFDARKRIKKMAMSAPPTPIDTAVVIDIALAIALVLDEVLVTVTMADSIFFPFCCIT